MSLTEHLASGTTTVCRAWALTRRDGLVLGFTDHDRPLFFENIEFKASSGMTARAVEQTTGLSVDNSEALGALSDVSIREEDVRIGRFDGAQVRSWLVNWNDVRDRRMVFQGSLGEIERQGTLFRVELRGLAEMLNQPQGRVYQRPCSAVLGDGRCGFDVLTDGYFAEIEVISVVGGTDLLLPGLSSFDQGWFTKGRLTVLDGAASGAVEVIKRDKMLGDQRQIELWSVLSAGLSPGDRVRLEAGCDKRADTCREKFGNFLNFRGFPDIPGEDWLVSYPIQTGANDGGSLRR